jgi:lysyl-tRNA synthetase class 2
MATLQTLIHERLKKLQTLRQMGIDPFGSCFPQSTPISSILGLYSPDRSDLVTTAGRITSIRAHGKTAFLDIKDYTGKIQLYIRKDRLPQDVFKLYELLDIGDIIGVKGGLFKTKSGEITILADTLVLLTKSLRPLPEKWHGLKDPEIRYRKRYLDLISSPDVLQTFLMRTRIIKAIRAYLDQQGFIEVETPMMQPIPGGATARPFVTHHNALDMELYLRIAPELYLKRLLVGGMQKIYEINRNFRNEGISPIHNPEFTMLELYQAYADYRDMMDLTERLIHHLATALLGGELISYRGKQLDLKIPWERKTYRELLKQHAGIDIDDFKGARKIADGLGIPQDRGGAALVNDIFEKVVEPHLHGPIFVLDYPIEICPLAKKKPLHPELCERFELFLAGMEIANAFTELNDPIDQRERFLRQIQAKEEGVRLDEDFLIALEHGMPPAGGLGIGIDRVVMILTDSPSVREVILFPLLRESPDV